jgi:hypothetical protein
MLSLNDFQKIKLSDKEIFDEVYKKYPPFHSDYIFTTLISWMKYGNYKFAYYKDNIILSSEIDNIIRLRPPIGKPNIDIFNEVLSLAKKLDAKYPLGMINLEKKKWIEINYPKLKFKTHRDFFEYVYLSSDLANLEGSDYRKIRNRLNKFIRKNDFIVEEISEENMTEIKKFLKRWCLWKDCESDPILSEEKKAIFFSIANFFKLGLNGILIRVNGDVESIAVFERMGPDTAIVHYEKGSPYYDGIYKAINQKTAKKLEKDFKYINRESDMGLSGLRRAKLSYKPHHMIEVFHIDKDSIP